MALEFSIVINMIFHLVLFFVFGAAIGSFLNVVINRVTQGESLLGRSYCDHCRATLVAIDLIPIISFVGLRARCRFCKKKISWQYPFVEAVTGVLFALSFWVLADSGKLSLGVLMLYFFLVSIFIVVAAIDTLYSLIPTSLVFMAALVTLFYNYFAFESVTFVVNIIAAFVLAISFLMIVVATRGRGMGTGDVPLVFLIGLVCGWPGSFVAIFLAFVVGGLVSVVLLFAGAKKIGQTIPFAPFLVFGTLSFLLFGNQIIEWYLRSI